MLAWPSIPEHGPDLESCISSQDAALYQAMQADAIACYLERRYTQNKFYQALTKNNLLKAPLSENNAIYAQ